MTQAEFVEKASKSYATAIETPEAHAYDAEKHLVYIQSLGLLADEENRSLQRQAQAEIRSGMSIIPGHPNWELVQNLMWAVRKSVTVLLNCSYWQVPCFYKADFR